MTAFVGSPASSTQYALVNTRDHEAAAVAGRLHVAIFQYTHALGAGDGEINLCKLPPGRIRIYSDLSRITSSQFAASSVMDLGHRSYVDYAGTTQDENDDAFSSNLDTASAAIDAAFALPTSGAPWHDFDTQDGLIIFASVDSGNIEDADVINGYVVYSMIA